MINIKWDTEESLFVLFLTIRNSIVDGIANSAEAPSEQESPRKKFLFFMEILVSVLRIRIRDPVPFWPLDPGSGMGKKSGSGSGMNNPDQVSESLKIIFWGGV